MTQSSAPSKTPTIVHWVVVVLLFLMIAQPTFDNLRALTSGAMVMGDVTIDVTFTQMALHVLAMVIGWVGFVLFVQRRKLGAYITIAAHTLGLIATATQTPEMFEVVPPAAIGVFFVILLAITLGPTQAFKDAYR